MISLVTTKTKDLPRHLASASRTLATSSNISKKILVITGGMAQMGPGFTRKALDRGYEVVSCSRKTPSIERQGPVKWVKIEGHEIENTLFWDNVLQTHCSEGDEVVIVNTIGAAVAPKRSSLENINEKPVIAALAALKKQRDRTGQRVAMGHISSICATYFPKDKSLQTNFCSQSIEYCSGRQRVDQALDQSDIPTTIVRPGFVFTDPRSGSIIDTGHAYSPEQFAAMPFQPIVGSGQQIQQPAHMDDVIDAVLNGLESDENHLVNAVGPEVMTQKEMFKFFTDLADKRFKPIHIPFDLAHTVAKHVPKGRVAPYSIGMFRHLELEEHKTPLCKENFESLVGRPLTSMTDLYSNLERSTVVLPKPPVREHVKEICKIIWSDPEARKDFTMMAAKYGLPMCIQAIKVLLT